MEVDPITMARTGQRVEHQYAGVTCGLMDQMVSRLGKSNHALLLDCRSLGYTHVPLQDAAVKIVVINSNVRRALASSKYNERRSECIQGLACLQQWNPRLRALRDVTLDLLGEFGSVMDPVLHSRARHVVEENARVHAAVAALRAGDWPQLGVLLAASHESLRRLYEVSCAELDFLVEVALAAPGVYGARMMGGGFGGCTISIVEPNRAEELTKAVQASYQRRFDRETTAWILEEGLEAAILV